MTTAHQWVQQHRQTIKDDFFDILRMPSISTDPAYAQDVQEVADWIMDQMQAIGLTVEQINRSEGRHPLVFGTWDGAGTNAKTVLIYCHYDVQPASKAEGWSSEPFEPIERDGKVFARGATDSKVHVIAQLNAVKALLATNSCAVNIKLLFEGEEESGSESITAFIKEHPSKAQADIAVISDGIIRAPDQPSLVYGLRGIITFELLVTGPQRDLHSGHFGGTVHNPIQVLAEIISKLHDSDGRVTVDGFYDAVALPTDEERALLALSDATMEEEWQSVANAPQQWGEPEFTLHERIGVRPTLEINGITGGYAGDGFKTVLPARALAKISCRLVPNQDPNTILEQVRNHILKIAPPTVTIMFLHEDAEAPAVYLDYQNPAMQLAYHAYEKGWGKVPVFERAGGSVPITDAMQKVATHVTMMGFSYKGGRAHGQDEHIYLDMLYKGIDTAIYFLQAAGEK